MVFLKILRLVCNSSTISAGFEEVPTQASLLRLIEEKGLLSNSTADSDYCRPPPSLGRSPAASAGRRRGPAVSEAPLETGSYLHTRGRPRHAGYRGRGEQVREHANRKRFRPPRPETRRAVCVWP